MRRFLRNNGLSLFVFAAFLIFWAAQALVGHHVYNDDQKSHGRPQVGFGTYLTTGHFVEATAENWESEFLQMGVFVWATAVLFQKGSPESNDPDAKVEEPPATERSPWPVRKGGWVAKLYGTSLSLAFLGLFLFSFALHAWGGSIQYSQEQTAHGEPPVSVIEYLGTSQLWFESFENWQSEFLAIGCMVVLGIYLRQKDSPESKHVTSAHDANE